MLGIGFCQKMFTWYLNSNKKFLFYIELDNICIGYCGGMGGRGSASAMTQYAMARGFFSLLVRPWLWFHSSINKQRKLQAVNLYKKIFKSKIPTNSKKTNSDESVGLVVIGVHPDFQSMGIGIILLKELSESLMS